MNFTIYTLSLFCLFTLTCVGQESSDRKPVNKNYLYIVPTSIKGDLPLGLNNFWAELGYQRHINKKHLLSVNIAYIVASKESNSLMSMDALGSSGAKVSVEHKFLIKDKLYYSTELRNQYTVTIREETIITDSDNLYMSQYSVGRYVLAIIPKVGVQFIAKHNLYFDCSFGAGARYISSYSSGKEFTDPNPYREPIWNKKFDSGSKIVPRFLLTLRVGYNF
jgi:hypothetical protein